MSDETLICYRCDTAGTAIELCHQAKLYGLQVAYMPEGGDLPTRLCPVEHRVYFLGSLALLQNIREIIRSLYGPDQAKEI